MDILTRLREKIAENRSKNDFLRQNGAVNAANRADEVLNDLESVLDGAPERVFSVEEAALASGMHPESIRRAVRAGRVGSQSARGCSMTLTESEVRRLAPRRKRGAHAPRATEPTVAARAQGRARHLAATL